MGGHLDRPFVVWVGQGSQRQTRGEVSATGPGGGVPLGGSSNMPSADPCRNDGKSHLVGCPEPVKKGCADTLLIGRSSGPDYLPAGLCELGVEPATIVSGCASGDVSECFE